MNKWETELHNLVGRYLQEECGVEGKVDVVEVETFVGNIQTNEIHTRITWKDSDDNEHRKTFVGGFFEIFDKAGVEAPQFHYPEPDHNWLLHRS